MSEAMAPGTFVEVGHYQLCKHGQGAPGDMFLSEKNDDTGRIITVLSDGLGSGIKAGVLSTLTATMALKFVAADIPIKRAAEIIMNTLPVDKDRGISYATFTLVDIAPNSSVRIMEYDNPGYVLIRSNVIVEPIKDFAPIERKNKKTGPVREAILSYSEYGARPGDRLIFFSDGVTQSGMGTKAAPLGWGDTAVHDFILEKIAESPEISARDLAKKIVMQANLHDAFEAKDDITCGVVYFRHPRDLLIITGPPVNPDRDAELGRIFQAFPGKKVLCGGTTANILSRELGRPVSIVLKNVDPVIPPISVMEGADLVTEGIITLGREAELLADGAEYGKSRILDSERENGASMLVHLLLDSDRITFVVGTQINAAHQDPNMPMELEIRRNVIKRIEQLLTDNYLKEVSVTYM